ncbi:MAG: LysR substrate-binding domain-containing protein [Lautropia sp.]
MDKFKLMSTFVQVVKSGSFVAAARELRVSKPLISKHIAALEAMLGVQLLYRTTRRIKLTEIGYEYHESCQQILEATSSAEQGISRLQAEPRGHIRITALNSIGVLFLGAVVSDFVKRFSGVKTTLVLSDSLSYGKEILNGGFDLAVHFGAVPDSRIVARKICEIPRYVCASPAYLEKYGVPATPKDLTGHNCLIHLAQAPDDVWHFDEGQSREHSIKVHGSVTANSMLALRAAALQGTGLAMLPSFCIEDDIAEGSLVRVLAGHSVASGPLCVLYLRGVLPRKVRMFIDFLVAWFNPPPWSRVVSGRRPKERDLQSKRRSRTGTQRKGARTT